MTLLNKALEQLGIEKERVRLEWDSASEGNELVSIVNSMTAKIKELGPLTEANDYADAR